MATDFRGVFRAIPTLLRSELPPNLQNFQWSATSWMAKAWYGNRALHYEIWVRHSAKVVEVGLHFEADALTNARLYGAFRARSREVKRGLGNDARIEEWDKGWSRVWQPLPLQKIDDDYAEMIQTRFVDYVRVLEPILRDELPKDVDWELAKAKPLRRAAKLTSSRGSRSG